MDKQRLREIEERAAAITRGVLTPKADVSTLSMLSR